MNSENIQTIQADDAHAHYGRFTDGKSDLGGRCMSATAGGVTQRARNFNVDVTLVSPLPGLIDKVVGTIRQAARFFRAV